MDRKKVKTDQIIGAAIEEFLLKGMDAASMHNIAEQAEVSKRTLYKYFPSKEELYDALVDEIFNRFEDMSLELYSSNESVEVQIEKLISKKIELLLTESFIKISRIAIGEMFKGRQMSVEQMERMTKSESNFLQWIQKAQQDKKIRSDIDSEIIASQFHSILKGQIYWPVLMGLKSKESIDREHVKKITMNFFMKTFVL
ncbi:putative TetR-family regulatory protein [Halobacteriovorax marinus SJ]|uniref:TetR-family regulatory protein n=1 Tax=Halobacteriovorax marinus (strain ATCC BAA-682 / DSM 15412 / SJ) TaxID=862908 RepID=E1X5Z6_HALMS|nr:TetR/AcrR family transcriptional regulator [Halobacteriovorax marinus]CBW25713.1 putative TetR-family regulatory protein [Halobacteriovorax marinus SJ]